MKRRPVYSGVLLKKDILEPLKLTITEVASNLGVSRKTLSKLTNERISLSLDMAVRIGRATDTSPESWMNMQSKLNLWKSEQKKFKVVVFPTIMRVMCWKDRLYKRL